MSNPLEQAALFAGRAPSLHNSQPWHWYVGADVLDLRLEAGRVLRSSDPDGRLAVLSCGAALHHAHLHLAAGGWRAQTRRLPDASDPALLARVLLDGPAPADHDAARLMRATHRRRTDRRSSPGAPLDLHRVHNVRRAVRQAGADLTVLRAAQIIALGEAAAHARDVEEADAGWQVEVASWVGGNRQAGTGIPAAAMPDDPRSLTAPARILRRSGRQLLAESHHHAAVFAVLHTATDTRADWLIAGEGLSAGWLTATALDVAVLPLSIVTEVAGSRTKVQAALGWSGHPQLALRLAVAGPDRRPATPRLPAHLVVTTDKPVSR